MPVTRTRKTAPLTSRAKVTSKGQITLPVALRRQLGVKAGDSVLFKTKGSGIVLVPQNQNESVFEKYRGIGTPGIAPGKKAVLEWVREIRGAL